MADARSIAAILGPTLTVIAASEAANMRIWVGLPAAAVYLNGALLFVAGLCILRAHSAWSRQWPVLITLTGWVGLLAGLYRLFFPGGPQATASVGAYIGLGILAALGLFLTVKAFEPSAGGRDQA